MYTQRDLAPIHFQLSQSQAVAIVRRDLIGTLSTIQRFSRTTVLQGAPEGRSLDTVILDLEACLRNKATELSRTSGDVHDLHAFLDTTTHEADAIRIGLLSRKRN
jgi:hypothetical protein